MSVPDSGAVTLAEVEALEARTLALAQLIRARQQAQDAVPCSDALRQVIALDC